MQFSNDFLWGAASASYQIEGAYLEDGKGENIWDAYCQESGHVAHGENGNVACDHYHRFREDVKMMQKIGIKNYRFSISWTRILPDGTGAVNQKRHSVLFGFGRCSAGSWYYSNGYPVPLGLSVCPAPERRLAESGFF